MKRPKGIEITTALMVLSLLIWIVQVAMAWASMPGIHATPKVSLEEGRAIFRGIEVFAALIAVLVLIFYSKGREWARTLVLLDCAVHLYALRYLHHYWQIRPTIAVVTLFNAMFALFLLWYLFQPEVRAWFKDQTLRAHRARQHQSA